MEVVVKRKGMEYVIDEMNMFYVKGLDIMNEVIVELLKIDVKKNLFVGVIVLVGGMIVLIGGK